MYQVCVCGLYIAKTPSCMTWRTKLGRAGQTVVVHAMLSFNSALHRECCRYHCQQLRSLCGCVQP